MRKPRKYKFCKSLLAHDLCYYGHAQKDLVRLNQIKQAAPSAKVTAIVDALDMAQNKYGYRSW